MTENKKGIESRRAKENKRERQRQRDTHRETELIFFFFETELILENKNWKKISKALLSNFFIIVGYKAQRRYMS